MPKKETSFDL